MRPTSCHALWCALSARLRQADYGRTAGAVMPGGPAGDGPPVPVVALARGGRAHGPRSDTTVCDDTVVVDLADLAFIVCDCTSVLARHCRKIRCRGSIRPVASLLTWLEAHATPGRPSPAVAITAASGRAPEADTRVLTTYNLPVLSLSGAATAVTARIWPRRHRSGAGRLQACARWSGAALPGRELDDGGQA